MEGHTALLLLLTQVAKPSLEGQLTTRVATGPVHMRSKSGMSGGCSRAQVCACGLGMVGAHMRPRA